MYSIQQIRLNVSISLKLFLKWFNCIAGASSASSIDSSLAVFSGNLVPYIITVCVLAIMFLSLVFILTYLVRMRKIVNRKINEIEEKDRRPAHVRAVDRYLLC